jgi:hypothetical protein
MELLILIFFIVAPGSLLLGAVALVSNHRWLRSAETRLPYRDGNAELPDDALDSGTLAGSSRRVLHSDHSGPGAVLRDELMHRPSSRDS